MYGQNGQRLFGWRGLLLTLLAALLAWQGAQVWRTGAAGVPGLMTFQVTGEPVISDADWGGVTVVAKTRRPATSQARPGPSAAALTPSSGTTTIARQARAPAPAAEVTASVAPALVQPLAPAVPAVPEPQGPSAAPPQIPAPPRAPVAAPQPAEPARLPWQTQPGAQPRVAALPAERPASVVRLPSESEVRGWIKAQAHEFVGGVDAQGMPLYRFDLWLETPSELRQRIVSVAYNFDAPSAKPRAQTSTDQKSGFRVKFGGASCARTVVVTVTLDDGRKQDAEVDGCAILS